MASTSTNIITRGLSGQLGKELVVKQYGRKTVITRYPDMSKVKPSALQQQRRNKFAEAVAYAKAINNNAELKAAYKQKLKKGQTVYHYALREYLQQQL